MLHGSLFSGVRSARWAVTAGLILACGLCCVNDESGPVQPVAGRPPSLRVPADTAVAVGDTLVLSVGPVEGSVPVLHYVWSRSSDPLTHDTTTDSTYRVAWGAADTGVQRVVVAGASHGGFISEPETVSVTVHLYEPFVELTPRDTVAQVRDTVLIRAAACDTNGTVVYYWRIDTGGFVAAGPDSLLSLSWGAEDTGRHVVYAYVLDEDSLTSDIDSAVVTVRLNPPRVSIGADTAVWARDTVVLRAHGADSGGIVVRYLWSIGDSLRRDTTDADSLAVVFGAADTGRWTVAVRCEDDDGVLSEPDTAMLRVRLGIPGIRLGGDTAVWAGDTLVIRAAAADTNGSILRYLWQVGEAGTVDTLSAESLSLSWELADTGRIGIVSRAVDDDGLVSRPDTLAVTVRVGRPRVVAPADMLVALTDTVVVGVAAIDSNGSIERYYWGLGSTEWIDSTTSPAYRLWYRGRDPECVVAGARDDDGLIGIDTVRVFFSNPSQRVVVHRPGDTNYVRMHDSSFYHGAVPFAVGCVDLPGLCDFREYTLYLGTDQDMRSVAYRGSETAFTLTGLDTAVYYRLLTAEDRWGNTYALQDSFVNVLAHEICFAGHSIAVGFGDEECRGGFRSVVLDSLRARRSGLTAVRSVGPFTTEFWPGSPDDSCLGVSGALAREIHESFVGHPELGADDWVVMIGVNGDYYTFWERYYTTALLSAINERNPEANLYVLNGLQVPDTVSAERQQRLEAFNLMLESLVADWRAAGRNIHLVDAFSALAPDSLFHPEYFADAIHPNRAGYDILGHEILKAMGVE